MKMIKNQDGKFSLKNSSEKNFFIGKIIKNALTKKI